MILPKDIKSRHKIRDANIIRLYLRESKTHEELGKIFGLTECRIGQILSSNSHLLTYDLNYEKALRVNKLKRIIRKLPEEVSEKKDVLDAQTELRKEIEGDIKSETTINNITYNIQGQRKRNLIEAE